MNHEEHNEDNQIRFKNLKFKSRLYDYSNIYLLFKGTITVENTAAQGQRNNRNNKKVKFKNCAPSSKCTSKINNMQVDDAHEVMLIYNLKEYSDNYSKTSGILWQYCRDEPALADDSTIAELLQIMLTILIRLKLSKI